MNKENEFMSDKNSLIKRKWKWLHFPIFLLVLMTTVYSIGNHAVVNESKQQNDIDYLVVRNLKAYYANKYMALAEKEHFDPFQLNSNAYRFPLPDRGGIYDLTFEQIDSCQSLLQEGVILYRWEWMDWWINKCDGAIGRLPDDSIQYRLYKPTGRSGIAAIRAHDRSTFIPDTYYYLSGDYYLSNNLREIFDQKALNSRVFDKQLIAILGANYEPYSIKVYESNVPLEISFSFNSGVTNEQHFGNIDLADKSLPMKLRTGP